MSPIAAPRKPERVTRPTLTATARKTAQNAPTAINGSSPCGVVGRPRMVRPVVGCRDFESRPATVRLAHASRTLVQEPYGRGWFRTSDLSRVKRVDAGVSLGRDPGCGGLRAI